MELQSCENKIKEEIGLQNYKENILKNILDGKIGNIKKVILCLNEESFRVELEKYNFQEGLLIEKDKNMELYGEIVFNFSTTVKATSPSSDYSICIICIKDAISISPIPLSGILAREITHVLDIIKKEKKDVEVDTLSFAAKRLMESALRFIEEVKTNGSDYEILGKVNVGETNIMEMTFSGDTLLTDEEMVAKEDAYMSELYDEAQEEALNNKDWSEEEKILNSSEPASFEKRLELKIR